MLVAAVAGAGKIVIFGNVGLGLRFLADLSMFTLGVFPEGKAVLGWH